MTKFISPRARFTGTLNGIKVEDLKGLDFNIETLEGRLKEVREKLEKVSPFFDEYFFTSEEEEDGEKPRQYYKFDPHTLKAFDKVIARKDSEDSWNIDFFSCFKLKEIPFCLGGIKCAVIPYDDDTEHLVWTTEGAPNFYKY